MILLILQASAAWAQMPPNHPANPGMDWQIPAAVLVAGLLIGFLVVSRLKTTDLAIEEESRRIDLQSTHDEVLEALKQLELEKPKMDPAEYAAERETLLARGARAMAVLDGAGEVAEAAPKAAAPAPQAAAPAPAGSGIAPEWRGALYALTAVAVVGGFIWFAKQGAKPRVGDMGMTGGDLVNDGNAAAPNAQNAQFQQSVETLKSRIEANPKDILSMNDLTQLYFSHGDPSSAMEWNTKALELDPKNADARVYRGVLSAMMSMPDRALQQLDEVLAEFPDHPNAVTYRGLILMEMKRFDEAVEMLELAVQLHNGNPVLKQALDQARALANGEVPPPMTPPGGGGDLIVSGTITLDPSVKLSGTETIFVSVANPARPGPPVAADKLGAGAFPQPFELTTADIRAMPGAGGVPATMDLKVRVDLDGNAMTKEAAPQAIVTGVAKGTSGLKVVLTMDGSATSAPPPAPTATGQVLVSGTAKLAPGTTLTGSETVFISVRDPAGGPPLAADKRVGVTFPMDFQITDAQVLNMGGGPRPMPDTLVVSVRLDNDGNAMTKNGEPAATLENVAKGTTGLDLTLQ